MAANLPDKDIYCHRTAFQLTCRECVVDKGCRLWQNLKGKNPQSAEIIDRWGCADEFTNMLLIENAQQGRQVGAAIESFRNAMVIQNGIIGTVNPQLAPPIDVPLLPDET